jgi:putative hydrolase of the HAD superfamily
MNREISFTEIYKKHARPLEPQSTGLKNQGFLKAPVKAVLFDIYGTLFISGSGDVQSAKEKIEPRKLDVLLNSHNLNRNAEEVISRYFKEIDKAHSQLREAGVDYPEVEIDTIWMKVLDINSLHFAQRFAVEFESIFNPVWPMPGISELFGFLKNKNILMGIVSNAQFFTPMLFKAFIGFYPEELGFSKDLMYYSFEHKYAKPSTRLYLKAKGVLELKSVSAENTLYVGNDMLNDIYPADAVGFQTALFAGDKRSLRLRKNDTGCQKLSPDLIVTVLTDISDCIEKQNIRS